MEWFSVSWQTDRGESMKCLASTVLHSIPFSKAHLAKTSSDHREGRKRERKANILY
jgi:hypothetical protein